MCRSSNQKRTHNRISSSDSPRLNYLSKGFAHEIASVTEQRPKAMQLALLSFLFAAISKGARTKFILKRFLADDLDPAFHVSARNGTWHDRFLILRASAGRHELYGVAQDAINPRPLSKCMPSSVGNAMPQNHPCALKKGAIS